MKQQHRCKNKQKGILEFIVGVDKLSPSKLNRLPLCKWKREERKVDPPKQNEDWRCDTSNNTDTSLKKGKKLLRLLGFPKAKPESGPGCSYCRAGLAVRSWRAGGPHTTARLVPGGSVAAGSGGSQHVCLPPSERKKGVEGVVGEGLIQCNERNKQHSRKKLNETSFSQPGSGLTQ